ncbi:uncharacterized protein LOC144906985 [Branchiostoma floridae x Branchiostoma belcheri]
MGQGSCKTGPSVFLCHAGEDKDRFVEPLYKALVAKGLKSDDIFYDKFSIEAGDQIKQSIESAIANSNLQLVVIVLSRSLLSEHKYWPKREFELAQKHGLQIIPIWLDHDLSDFDTLVRKYSPTLKELRAHCVTCDSQTGLVNDRNIQAVADDIISKTAKRSNTGYGHFGVWAMVAVIAVVIAVILGFYLITRDDPYISATASFLKILYDKRYSYIQPLPWKPGLRFGLADGYINLRMQRESDRGSFITPAEVVTPSELVFNSHENSRKGKPTRIIVEGEPGGGKSTLCRKLVIDWVERITDFTLVFLIGLRRFNGSVMDSVYDQLLGDNLDISKTELKEYIKHHQEKVCFILDGFDELNVEYQKNSDVLDLIKGKIFYGSTVLVTSRPLKLREVLKDSDAFYKIVGFRQDQKDEIFQKYFINDSNSANELSATVSKNHYLKEITENPLNALLICVLWEDNNQRLPKTKTELYGEVVKSITKRYCAKFDIKCDGRSFPASVDVLLLSQGRLAWKGSKINKFHFDIDDMEGEKTTDVLPLGMMVQGETDSRTSGYTYVSFLHPTLQEFMAAYYIHHMLHKEGALTAELLNTIVKREELEGILIFLCGLSGDQVKPLLDDFHDATNEKALTMKEEYVSKSLVRRCLTCLGATNVAAKLADTVAPAMPEEVVFDFDYLSVEWTEGFIAIVQFLQKSLDDTLQKTFRTLVLASIHWAVDIPRDVLVRFRSVLESTTVVESVIMTGWSMPLVTIQSQGLWNEQKRRVEYCRSVCILQNVWVTLTQLDISGS